MAVSENSNNTNWIKTLFHEAAPVLFNHRAGEGGALSMSKGKGREVGEVEAEAVVNLTLSFIGIEYELSAGYINGWNADKDRIDKTEIIKVVDKPIKAIQPEQLALSQAEGPALAGTAA